MDDDFPEWAARLAMAEALRAVGLPWVPWAAWRKPKDFWMSYEDRLVAIALDARAIAEARRRLPAGMSGAVIGREFRRMSWRCIVAGLALLDADARSRLAARNAADDGPEPVSEREPEPVPAAEREHGLRIVRHEPAVNRQRPGDAKPAAPLFIRRGGEVKGA